MKVAPTIINRMNRTTIRTNVEPLLPPP